jgi:MSHA pilin protein MshD
MSASLGPQGGVTLIELVISIVVIAIALSALTIAVSDNVRRSADPMIQEQASAIAQAYLEEIMLHGFCDPDFDPDGNPATGCSLECNVSVCSGGCGGPIPAAEARDAFDDVCDYAGLSDAGARDQAGNAVPGLGQYTVGVSVTDQGVSLGGTLPASAGRAVLIDVTVSHPQADNVVMSAFKANF